MSHKNKTVVGKIHPKRTLFLCVHAGDAEVSKLKYHLFYIPGGTPIVQSGQTGQWFTLSWHDIIDLTVKAGIDTAIPQRNTQGRDNMKG